MESGSATLVTGFRAEERVNPFSPGTVLLVKIKTGGLLDKWILKCLSRTREEGRLRGILAHTLFTVLIVRVILCFPLHEDDVFELRGWGPDKDFKRILIWKLFFNLQKVILSMGADLGSRSSSDVLLHLPPLLSVFSESLHKSTVFFIGPPANNLFLPLRF